MILDAFSNEKEFEINNDNLIMYHTFPVELYPEETRQDIDFFPFSSTLSSLRIVFRY